MEIRKLTADEIEAKVKTISEKGVQLLLYKTARTDRQILDEVFGAMNWTSDYKEIKGNLYCGIGCRENAESPFVWKWDCGVESREDGDGNEKKGEASDSFKRAGFQWGIGVELYTSPFIWVKVPTKCQAGADGKPILRNGKKIWQLENSFERFSVAQIAYDDNGRISDIVIVNSKGEIVFETKSKQPAKTTRSEFEKAATTEKKALNAAVKANNPEAVKPNPMPLSEQADKLIEWLDSLTAEQFKAKADSAKDKAHDVRDALLSSNLPELVAKGVKIADKIKAFEPEFELNDEIRF